MKTSRLLPFLFLIMLLCPGYKPSPEREIFVGATPCDPVARHLLSIPMEMQCEMIKWKIALQRHPRDQNPTRFTLQYTYGMTKPGTQGFANDGVSKEINGEWHAEKNAGKAPGGAVFVLKSQSKTPIRLLRLDDRLLHLLDLEGKLMIGNAGFSYTFNRSTGI
nr:hypothetical protein [uncultured Dyadobacter sp.]